MFLHLILSIIIGFAVLLPATATPKETVLLEGQHRAVCRKLEAILNAPENQGFISKKRDTSEFNIPSQFMQFRLPQWKDVPVAGASHLMKPGKYLDELLTPRFGPMQLQKTEIDFDPNGTQAILLRYKLIETKEWRCYLSDIKPSIMAEGYDFLGPRYPCFIFYYRQHIYQAGRYDGSSRLGIGKFTFNAKGQIFGVLPVCLFDSKEEK